MHIQPAAEFCADFFPEPHFFETSAAVQGEAVWVAFTDPRDQGVQAHLPPRVDQGGQ